MAKDKKTVVVYTDWGTIFDVLTNEEAGRLIKHFFDYVRDKSPVAPDRLTLVSFEPLKQKLKEDLLKWESKSEIRSEIGKKGGKANAEKVKQNKPIESETIKNEAKEPVNVNVSVNGNGNESVNVDGKEKDLASPISDYKICVEFWLKELHPGWSFTGQSGKAIKSIISKIKKLLKESKKTVTEKSVVESFKFMCLHLPEWYKTKDLQVLDSKFNEIVEEIKNGQSNSKNRSERVNEVQHLHNLSQAILDDHSSKNS